MRASYSRSRTKQLTLFQLQATMLRWEDLPSPMRAELVRLMASLLLRLQAHAANRAGASVHE
jgi:hypothetical protein